METSKLLTRRDLEKIPRKKLHRARNWSKAEVTLGEWPPDSGERVVIKDISSCPMWFRLAVGRHLMRREAKALRVLEKVPGVPRLLAQPDSDVLVIEFLPGRKAKKFATRTLSLDILNRVSEQVALIHEHGVAHGDLHPSNILVDENGDVAFIDWATAQFAGASGGPKARLFEECLALDCRAIAKLKCRHVPRALSNAEQQLLKHGTSRPYRFFKGMHLVFAAMRGKANYAEMRGRGRYQESPFARKIEANVLKSDSPTEPKS